MKGGATAGNHDEKRLFKTINRIYGNLSGLKAEQLKKISQIYRRKLPPDRVLTQEFARLLTELSREINRQIGILISRRGEIVYVIVGTNKDILLPDLEGFRSSSVRFKGLRLIHTHLKGEPLSTEDLSDLALLRLDLVCAVEVGPDGLPGFGFMAHLIPENPEGNYWTILDPVRPSEMDLNFTAFIQALESEFARKQRTRKVDSTDRAILIRAETNPLFDSETSLAELKDLCRSCGVEVFGGVIQHRNQIDPKYVLGKGKLADLVIHALQIGANLLIFDQELHPAQVRSITDFTQLKVIDRTQVILDIFARRAQSREGKIQVELAQLKYLLPRLVTKNTAMSRLTGGIGGRGPGETKLQINRRLVRDRIHRLEQDLAQIGKARDQRRVKREKARLPVISIVGYTNAGKSTLLNTITKSLVLTEDRLFATLDPKSSRLRFPRDREAVITDTVGFIRDLPKDLFAAFRATLDELQEADVLLHVIDVSNPNFEDHIRAVEKILEELGIVHKPTIRIFNKEDRFSDKTALQNLCRRFEAVAISALNTETLAALMEKLEYIVCGSMTKGNYDKKYIDHFQPTAKSA
ncbi:MAG: GTPase HflX [Deltaproteobacteria bacterium]|nr:GTPase HflX [Deltaproteobacteria bacterium]